MKQRSTHHGGAWKVAYADFVTAMMALFLVLWLTAQDTKIKEAVERAFRNPFSAVNKESTGLIPQKDSTSQFKAEGNFQSVNALEVEMLRHITEDLAKILQGTDEEQKSVQLDLTPEGLRINVFDRSHKPVFEPDSDVFTSYGAWVFSTLAWEISRYQTFKIELEGHTEAAPDRDRESRSKWELSAERANAARRKLVQNGVSPGQVYKVSGFADTQPMPKEPPAAEINRRVTVLLKLENPDVQTGSTESPHANRS
jgi:chemotaxis protein MotB